MVVIFPDHTVALSDPLFSNKVECKITGVQALEKGSDLKDTQIIRMAAWNLASDPESQSQTHYIIETEIVNGKLRLFTRLELSCENMPYNIEEVNWMDCFYKKDAQGIQLYCFANVQVI